MSYGRTEGFRSLRRAMGFYFWLIPGADTGNQEGISCPAGHDSGLCPENPQAFRERLERKLQFAHGRDYSFTAPAVRDDTTCSWKIAKTAIDGITAIVMAANIAV